MKKTLFLINLMFLYGCSTTLVKISNNAIDQTGISIPIEEPPSDGNGLRVLNFCIEPTEDYGRDIKFDPHLEQVFTKGEERIKFYAQFLGSTNSKKYEFPAFYLNKNLTCISIFHKDWEKYKLLNISSSSLIKINKAYWYLHIYL